MDDAGLKPDKKDSTILAALPYVLGTIVALLIYLLSKDDKFARFHALQSVILGLALIPVFLAEYLLAIILFITIIGYIAMIAVIFLTVLTVFVFNLYLAYSAFSGKSPMVPWVGKLALDHVE